MRQKLHRKTQRSLNEAQRVLVAMYAAADVIIAMHTTGRAEDSSQSSARHAHLSRNSASFFAVLQPLLTFVHRSDARAAGMRWLPEEFNVLSDLLQLGPAS